MIISFWYMLVIGRFVMVGVWKSRRICLENTILPQGRVFDNMMNPVKFDSEAEARNKCAMACDEREDCFFAQFRAWTVMSDPQDTPYFACGLVGKDDCTPMPDLRLLKDQRSIYHKGIADNLKHF